MKKKIGVLFAAICVLFALASLAGCGEHIPDESTDSGFDIGDFRVTMEISERRTIAVTEEIEVTFNYRRSGIIRDFDLTGGVRYENISALRDGATLPVSMQSDSSEMLSFYLGEEGDYVDISRPHVYKITYTMIVPALKDGNYLPLDVLGFDWYTGVENFSATLRLPAPAEALAVYSGGYHTTSNDLGVTVETEGNTVYLSAQDIRAHRGITLDLKFAAGVLKAPPLDLALVFAPLLILGIVLVIVLVRVFAVKQPLLTTTVGLSAPEEMDPLLMGKLVDGTVDSEDLGALIFYLAAQGYLTIDLTDEDDPQLSRTEKAADELPVYVKNFLDGLFRLGDPVRASMLTNCFYRTAGEVKAQVSASAGRIWATKGRVMLILFGILTVLAAFAFPVLWEMTHVSLYCHLHLVPLLIFTLGAFVASAAFSSATEMRRYKWKRWKRFLMGAAGLLIGAFLALFTFGLYPVSMSRFVVPILTFGTSISGMVCGSFVIREKKYTERLGLILGFKEFILYTEKDKIAFMLREDPALYYNILPYAQVLGVTDAWTKKFEGLDLKPPAYVRSGSDFEIVVSAVWWNRIFRAMSGDFSRSMISRPSNTGGGHGGGSFGGGFGGGGFGGGGGRSF